MARRKTESRVELTRQAGRVLLETVISRLRWYWRRACAPPEHIWGAFSNLCWELGEDPHAIADIEIRSPRQVWTS